MNTFDSFTMFEPTICSIDDGADTGGGDSPASTEGADTGGMEAAPEAPAVESAPGEAASAEAAPEAAAVPPPAAPAVDQAVIDRMVQERIQAAMAQAQPPTYMQQLLQSQQQQTEMFNRLLQQAEAQTARQRLEASRPRQPEAGAPLEEWQKYYAADSRWTMDQITRRSESQVMGHVSKLENMVRELAGNLEAERARAAQQAQQAQQQALFQRMASQPQYGWVKDENRAAVVQALHTMMAQSGQNVTLEQVAGMVASTFGLNGPTQQAQNAARRATEQQALQAQRNQVRNNKGPLPSSTTSRAGTPMRSSADAVRRAMASGAKFPPEMLEAYGLKH